MSFFGIYSRTVDVELKMVLLSVRFGYSEQCSVGVRHRAGEL